MSFLEDSLEGFREQVKTGLLGGTLLKSRMTAMRQVQEKSRCGLLRGRVMPQNFSGDISRSQRSHH